MNELIGKMKVDLLKAVLNVNDCTKRNDINRNHVNYGVAITCANVLRTLGKEVDIACWKDAGYLKIENIIVDGVQTIF